MLCDEYKEALIDAAALGQTEDELAPKLREHVDGCRNCRLVRAAEQSLLTAIEEGLKRRVRNDVPADFALRVRSRTTEQRVTSGARRLQLQWAAVAAAIAMAFVVFMVRDNLRRGAEPSAVGPVAVAVSSSAGAHGGSLSAEKAFEEKDLRVSPKKRSSRRPTRGVVEANFQPLIPSDQEEIVELLVRKLRNGEVDGRILRWDVQPTEAQDWNIAPMQIEALGAISAESGGDRTLFDSSRATDRRTE